METDKPLLAAFRRGNNEQCRLTEEIPGTVFSCRPKDTPFALQPGRSEEGQRTRTSILLRGLRGSSTQRSFEMCHSSLHRRNKACGQCRAGSALCELAKTGLLWVTVLSLWKQERDVPVGLAICFRWCILLEFTWRAGIFRIGE